MRLQKRFAIFRPGMPVAQTDAMAPFFVNVQVERDAMFAKGVSEHQTVFDRHSGVFERVEKKSGGRVARNLFFVGKKFDELFGRIRAKEIFLGTFVRERPHRDDGITKNSEVGPGTFPFDRIFSRGIAGVEMSQQR